MYSGCDYPYKSSLVCVLFDPAIPTSSFSFIQLFLYLLYIWSVRAIPTYSLLTL